MPFAGYADFAACVAANGDKNDAKAFCAGLEQQTEKLAKEDRFRIAKADDVQQIVFGWASVAVKADGVQLEDLQEDEIDGSELEKAAYQYVYESGAARDMHKGEPIGRLVEAFALTDEKIDLMGLQRTTAPKMGFWAGYKIPDRATYERVKATRKMLSIGGTAHRRET